MPEPTLIDFLDSLNPPLDDPFFLTDFFIEICPHITSRSAKLLFSVSAWETRAFSNSASMASSHFPEVHARVARALWDVAGAVQGEPGAGWCLSPESSNSSANLKARDLGSPRAPPAACQRDRRDCACRWPASGLTPLPHTRVHGLPKRTVAPEMGARSALSCRGH